MKLLLVIQSIVLIITINISDHGSIDSTKTTAELFTPRGIVALGLRSAFLSRFGHTTMALSV